MPSSGKGRGRREGAPRTLETALFGRIASVCSGERSKAAERNSQRRLRGKGLRGRTNLEENRPSLLLLVRAYSLLLPFVCKTPYGHLPALPRSMRSRCRRREMRNLGAEEGRKGGWEGRGSAGGVTTALQDL
jgi:hypothetical protein